jgi:transglutaminase-like putative cysteine protease
VAPRVFRNTSRTRVTALDDRRLRVVVSPAPELTAAIPAAPLDPRARARALADGPSLRLDHARIRGLARELIPSGTDAVAGARRVNDWVHRHLRYEVTASGGDAAAILERGRGDCTEYSQLAVALLRAGGVPAEQRSGIAAGDGELVAHAWVAFHDGTGWREIDPTWGRLSVGADHIDTSVIDFVALVTLDKLTVTAVEAGTD